jgi:rhomboid-related protein 1/2/3
MKGGFFPRTCFALQYDPEGFGEIPWDDFLEVLNNPEFIAEVDANKRDMLLERAQERSTSAITFQDFVNVVSVTCAFCLLGLN